MFAGRFEADGAGFLYRERPTAMPVRVTAPEREVFIAQFSKSLRVLHWSFGGGVTVATVVLASVLVWFNIDLEAWWIWLAMVPVIGIYVLAWHRISRAPARALEGRIAVAPGRDRAEVLKTGLKKLSWGQLAMLPLIAAYMLFRGLKDGGPLLSWNSLWLVGAAVFLGLGAYRGLQKLRVR